MLPNSKQHHLLVRCEKCHQFGYILVDKTDGQYFVICQKCGGETSLMYCKKCDAGGCYVDKIETRPKTWTCDMCKARHSVPKGFYENPVNLVSWKELPSSIQKRMENDQSQLKTQRKKKIIWGMIGLAIMAIIIFPPNFILTSLGYILHINLDHARNLWWVIFFSTCITFFVLSLINLRKK